jgi:amino acid permease
MSKTFVASAALIGTIIGAGFLGIPYVIMKSGFIPGILIMLFVFAIIVITKLYFGEIILRTKTIHQEAGYAWLYLGEKGKFLMFLSMIFGIYSALLAYLIAEGQSLSFILFGNLNYQLQMGLAFWFVLSILVYFGINSLKKGEPMGVILVFVMLISISVLLWNKIDVSNLTYLNWPNTFIPFGVILFSFLGYSALPEVRRIIGESGNTMKKSIWIANITALICYLIFTFVVLGAKGPLTPQIATLALGKPFVLLGIITMFTAYLSISIALTDMFAFDFRRTRIRAWLYTISVPVLLFLALEFFQSADFIKIINLGGILSGGLAAILILFMVKNAKKLGTRKPEYEMPYSSFLTILLIIIFIVAMFLEIKSLFT